MKAPPSKEEARLGEVRLIRGIRVELGKPIGMSWDDFGALLRDRRAVMHRLLNAGTAHLWSSQFRGERPQALEAIKRELTSYQEWCTKQSERERDPKQKETLLRRASMRLSSSITDAAAQKCFQNLQAWNRGKQHARVPSAKKGAPILIRDGGWKLVRDEQGLALDTRLIGRSAECPRPGKVRVSLRPTSGKHHAALRRIELGTVKAGDCKIVFDEGAVRPDGKRGKWFAILSYSETLERAPIPDDARALIIHRGMRNFLYALAPDGRTRELKGGAFMSRRIRLKARMKAAREVRAFERGGGAKGHGTERRYQTHDVLDDKMKNLTHTYCQQAAAWCVKIARELGCKVILIEEYGGQEPSEDRAERRFLDHFPYHRLKQSIEWACKRDGFELREYDACFISQTCPRCGHADARQHNVRTGIFHCMSDACDFKRHADWVAAYHAGKLAKADMSEIDRGLAQQRRIAEQMRAIEQGAGA